MYVQIFCEQRIGIMIFSRLSAGSKIPSQNPAIKKRSSFWASLSVNARLVWLIINVD